MKKVSKEELAAIIERHGKWLRDEAGGERANLSWMDLSEADLSWADLRRADLRGANLTGANMEGSEVAFAALNGEDGDFPVYAILGGR